MAWKMMDGYEMVIGLEVHVELKTKTKIFCACPTTFGAAPNTQCCPVCMGFPGTLPVLNRQVVHYAVLAGSGGRFLILLIKWVFGLRGFPARQHFSCVKFLCFGGASYLV